MTNDIIKKKCLKKKAFSMTLSHGAKAVNFYEKDSKIPCIFEVMENGLFDEKNKLIDILRNNNSVSEDRIKLVDKALSEIVTKWTRYESAIKNDNPKEIRNIYISNIISKIKKEIYIQGVDLLYSIESKSYEEVSKKLEKGGLEIVSKENSNLPKKLSFNKTLDFFISDFTEGGMIAANSIYKNTQVGESGGISRQTFSKIRNNRDPDYHPTKKMFFCSRLEWD